MFMTNMTLEERMSRATVAWMKREPSLAGVLMIGEVYIPDTLNGRVITACTNGRDEWYGRSFMEALNDAQLRFVKLHEVYHKMYRHPTTWGHLAKIDHRLANMSMDFDIDWRIMNAYGKDGFVEMPENIAYGDGEFFTKCCYDEQFAEWGTAKIFWHLYNESGGSGAGDPGRGGEGGSSGDVRDIPNGGDIFDEVDFDGAEELTREEKQELDREIDEALRQGALAAGKMGNGGSRDVEGLLEPKIDWRAALQDWASATCSGNDISTWRRPNRRYLASGYYMPSGISETIRCLHQSNDMSGSIGSVESAIMLTELVNICNTVRPDELYVSYWDTEVRGFEKYDTHEIDTVVDRTKPIGGGGTDVSCVPKYLTTKNIKPEATIVLTDGYIWADEWGVWDHPVLWVIIDNKQATPPCGSVIHVSREDFVA